MRFVLGRTNALDGVVPTCGSEAGTSRNLAIVQCSSKRYTRSITAVMSASCIAIRRHANQLVAILGSLWAGGVFRLRCERTSPSIIVMPTPGRFPC